MDPVNYRRRQGGVDCRDAPASPILRPGSYRRVL
jgi:hypothetical protein